MINYQLVERKPTADEMIGLRESVGWGIPDKQSLQKGIDNSLYGVCAIADNKIVGTARVVGDGVTVFYMQDVIVNPLFQRAGVGMAMMKAVMNYIAKNACNGAVVGLLSAKGKEEFYERFGFWKRPNENFGAGMMQFWKTT